MLAWANQDYSLSTLPPPHQIWIQGRTNLEQGRTESSSWLGNSTVLTISQNQSAAGLPDSLILLSFCTCVIHKAVPLLKLTLSVCLRVPFLSSAIPLLSCKPVTMVLGLLGKEM